MVRKVKVSIKLLRDLLSYDPDTGEFVWLKIKNHQSKDGKPGRVNGHGYREIRVQGNLYKASQLAWALHFGRWPKNDVDHKNRIRGDDRIKNLRSATKGQNALNKKPRTVTTSKFKGVSMDRTGRYCSRITIKGRQIWLGYFDCEIEAARIYDAAAIKLHGKFAFLNVPPSAPSGGDPR